MPAPLRLPDRPLHRRLHGRGVDVLLVLGGKMSTSPIRDEWTTEDGSVRLLLGDCLAVMPTLAACSVDSIVTDPPYGLSFMGKNWDHGVPGEHFWKESIRVAKPGAHLLAFGGTRTYHRLACAIEDAGWEIRDCLMWVYGSGFPKSHNLKGDWQGWGTALKPAWEPIIVARKPLAGTVAENVAEFGTGAMNIDASRIATDPSIDDPRLGGSGTWGTESAAKNVYEGGYAGERVCSSPLGRWPANLIHDGSEEVVGLFPQSKSTGGQASLGAFRNGDVYGKGKDVRESRDPGFGDSGSAARFFYCAKAGKADRDEGLKAITPGDHHKWNGSKGHRGIGDFYPDGSPRPVNPARNHHPTVKPTDLMRYLCRLVTPPDGVVLDPFMGSGSTGKAAMLEGFRFVGIEQSAEYLEIAQARVKPPADMPLFAEATL